MHEEQQKILDFMHAMKEQFGDYEFRVTLKDEMKLRSRKFQCKACTVEIIPHVAPKPIEKKKK
jgi:hypothetical protein